MVTVEGERSSACFLVDKNALRRYVGVSDEQRGPTLNAALPTQEGKPGASPEVSCLVTGPLAYDRLPSDFLSIGDAAGMIDPFCGEGMRHALDTGMCAAKVIAAGLSSGQNYTGMRASYEEESTKRWRGKRRLGGMIRVMLKHSRLTSMGFRLNPEYWFRKLWD